MNFVFKKDIRDICFKIFEESPDYKTILEDLADKIIENRNDIYIQEFDQKNQSLIHSIPSEIIKIDNNKISFSDKTYLIFFIASKNIQTFVDNFENDSKFINLIEKTNYEYEFRWSYISIIIILLNKYYNLNIIDKFLSYLISNDENYIFNLYNSFSFSITYLDIDNNKLIDVLDKIREIKNISLNDNFNLCFSFREISIENPLRAKSIFDELIKKDGYEEIIVNILLGLSQSPTFEFNNTYKITMDIASNISNKYFNESIRVLSLFSYKNRDIFKDNTFNYFNQLLLNKDSKILSILSKGFSFILNQDDRVKDSLLILSKSTYIDVLEQIAWGLIYNKSNNINNKWYKEILMNLTSMRKNNSFISNILYSYLDLDSQIVFDFIDKWLKESNVSEDPVSNVFPIFKEILKKQEYLLQKYLTEWINSDNYLIHNHLSSIFTEINLKKKELEFDINLINNLSEKDIKYILIKTLGYVLYSKEILCSLIFSLLKRDKRSNYLEDLIVSSFIDYIAYSFPGYSLEFIKNKVINGNTLEKEIANKILERIETYYDDIYNLPKIKELSPSKSRLKYYNNQYNKYFQKIYNETEKNSIIYNIIPVDKTPIKGGTSFFWRGENNSKIPLVTIKKSQEIDRFEHIDRIGLENLRFGWRLYRRNDEVSN